MSWDSSMIPNDRHEKEMAVKFRDGFKRAVHHLKQLIPMVRDEFGELKTRKIPLQTNVEVKIDGDVLDRVFMLLEDLSNRDNIERIKTIFQYSPIDASPKI